MDAPSAHRQNSEDPKAWESFDERIKNGSKTPYLDHTIPERLRSLAESSDLVVFPAERLDHKCGIERLVGNVRNFSSQLLSRSGHRSHLSLEDEVCGQKGRSDRESNQRQKRIGDDET